VEAIMRIWDELLWNFDVSDADVRMVNEGLDRGLIERVTVVFERKDGYVPFVVDLSVDWEQHQILVNSGSKTIELYLDNHTPVTTQLHEGYGEFVAYVQESRHRRQVVETHLRVICIPEIQNEPTRRAKAWSSLGLVPADQIRWLPGELIDVKFSPKRLSETFVGMRQIKPHE